MYDVVIRYEDGRRSAAKRHIEDLGDACAFVLELAEELGQSRDDEKNAPKWVEIHRDDRLEISVSVVTGGLLKTKAG